MNNGEIINLAREAGFPEWWMNPPEPERDGVWALETLGEFARLVAVAEREKCARSCLAVGFNGEGAAGEIWAKRCADAIRSMPPIS